MNSTRPLTVGQVLDVETLRGEILEMQRSKHRPKWVHLDELFDLIDGWEARQAYVVGPLFTTLVCGVAVCNWSGPSDEFDTHPHRSF